MQMQQTGKVERKKVNTRNILFIVSGAFAGLDEIIARRLNQGAIGFRLNEEAAPSALAAQQLYRQVRTEDLMEYGFESEFIGRLPVVAILHELDKDDLLSILRSPKSSVILAKKRDFRAYGIEVEFSDDALELLAERAHEERTGARSLVGAVEKALLPFEKKLPSSQVKRFKVDGALVKDPQAALLGLLGTSSLDHFLQSFASKYGIELTFSPDAEQLVMETAAAQQSDPAALCEALFTDYGHGLKLAGLSEFTLSTEAVHSPQEVLNEVIRSFYKRSE